MRHRIHGRKLNRPQAQRKALGKHMIVSLFTYGRIITTVEKAKNFRPIAEKLITKAKKGGLANFRLVLSEIQNKHVVHKLFDEIAPRFEGRNGGYTRIIRLGGSRWDGKDMGKYAHNRLGDNGSRAVFELVVTKSREEELAPLDRKKKALKKNEKGSKEAKTSKRKKSAVAK